MEINELIAEYELGEEARTFLDSDLGQYLVGCANSEIESYRTELETVNSTDQVKIMQLQNNIATRKHVFKWLVDCVNAGKNAGDNLEISESED